MKIKRKLKEFKNKMVHKLIEDTLDDAIQALREDFSEIVREETEEIVREEARDAASDTAEEIAEEIAEVAKEEFEERLDDYKEQLDDLDKKFSDLGYIIKAKIEKFKKFIDSDETTQAILDSHNKQIDKMRKKLFNSVEDFNLQIDRLFTRIEKLEKK